MPESDWEQLNTQNAIWLREPSDISELEYEKFYQAISKVPPLLQAQTLQALQTDEADVLLSLPCPHCMQVPFASTWAASCGRVASVRRQLMGGGRSGVGISRWCISWCLPGMPGSARPKPGTLSGQHPWDPNPTPVPTLRCECTPAGVRTWTSVQ